MNKNKDMAVKKTAKIKAKRNEVRITDIPDDVFKAFCKDASDNERSLSKQGLMIFKNIYTK